MSLVAKSPMGVFTFNVENKVIGGTEVLAVSARELHKELEVGRDFSNWVKDRLEKSRFVLDQDFTLVFANFGENPKGGRPAKEYYITIEMAKHLCMMENNERGYQARCYFIEVEKKHQAMLPESYEAALENLLATVKRKNELEKQLVLAAPKVEFADAVIASEELYTINGYSKWVNDQHNLKTSERKLFAFLRSRKYIMNGRNPLERNIPYQRYIDDGTFVVKTQKLSNGPSVGVTHITSAGAVRLLKVLKANADLFEKDVSYIEKS